MSPHKLLCALALTFPLLFALGEAAAQEPSETLRGSARAIATDLEEWDLVGARAKLARFGEANPGELADALRARLSFEEGDYAKAVALFDKLGDGSQLAEVARAALAITRGYDVRKSEHFSIHFPPGKDALLAPYALDTLERERAALGRILGHVPPEVVRVEILNDAEALSKVSTLSIEAIKTTGTIAICKFSRLMVTSPKALVRGYEWLDTLAHEYVHLVLSQQSRNRVPIWIHEGIAKYLESAWRSAPGDSLAPSSAWQLSRATQQNRLIPFERMHPSIALLPSQEEASLAYAEAYSAIEYLFQSGLDAKARGDMKATEANGKARLASLLSALARGEGPERAMGAAVGGTFEQFERGWRAHLTRRPIPKEAIPFGPEKLLFTEDEARSKAKRRAGEREVGQDLRFGDFLEIEDPKARRFAHLGELLRQRGRNGAAAEEYSKAFALVGSRSPTLSNRYAQALTAQQRGGEAKSVLEASRVPYPSYPRTNQALGDLYLAEGRLDDAERAFLAVIAVDPFDPLPHAALAAIYKKRGDDFRAEREARALALAQSAESPLPDAGALLELTSRPLARVYVDGTDTGRTTPTRLTLPAGAHILRLVNEERALKHEEKLTLHAGEERALSLELGAKEGERDGGEEGR